MTTSYLKRMAESDGLAVRPIAGQTTAIAIIAPLEKRTARTMVIVKITLPTVAPKTVANAIRVIAVITSVKTTVTTAALESFIAKINKTERSISRAVTHGTSAARILQTRRNHLAVASKQVIIRMTTLALKLVKTAAVCCLTRVMKAAAGAAAAQALITITLAYLIVIAMPLLMTITLEGTCTGRKPQLRKPQLPSRNLKPRSLP
jgi:hypothetical protein